MKKHRHWWIGILASVLISACSTPPDTTPPPTDDATTEPTEEPATLAPTSTPEPITVNVWLTTGDEASLLEAQADIQFSDDADGERDIYVNENTLYQEMDGFGASITDSSAWLIGTQMDADQRHDLLTELFSTTEGIGISAIRVPMGASDFTHGAHYSYDDLPAGETDPELENFSIEHDQAYIIPVLQEILAINPDVQIIASPWSVPGWMKTTDLLIKGSLRPEFYDAYAQYFVKFIQAYEAEGIPIYAVTPQNEPRYEPNNYPGMAMEPEDAAIIIEQHMLPAFEDAGLDTKILIWDHNWDQYDYPMDYLAASQQPSEIGGVAWHCYGGNVLSQTLFHNAYPHQDQYFTECSGGEWIGGFEAGLMSDMKGLTIGATRGWAKTVIKWNLALDTNHEPNNGGCENCDGLVTIDASTGEVAARNFDYYSIGHASKFVRNGAYRIASSTRPYNGLETVAFRNPDGSKALIAANTTTDPISIAVHWGDQSFSYTLPANAVATFTWAGDQQEPQPPKPPTDLAVYGLWNDTRLITWEFSALADTYTVQRAESSGGEYTVIAEGLTTPEFIDPEASDDATYYYVITAVNASGESDPSDEAIFDPNAE